MLVKRFILSINFMKIIEIRLALLSLFFVQN